MEKYISTVFIRQASKLVNAHLTEPPQSLRMDVVSHLMHRTAGASTASTLTIGEHGPVLGGCHVVRSILTGVMWHG